MEVPGVGGAVRVDAGLRVRAADRPDPAARLEVVLARLEERRIVRSAAALRDSVIELQTALRQATGGSASAGAVARSSADFHLDPEATRTTLTSTEQVNTETTDFSPVNPTWAGASTANPTVGGLYDGAQGSGALTFTVIQWGFRGFRDARIRVTGPSAELVDTFRVRRFDPVDQVYQISNGLGVSFAGNFFAQGDTFTVDVLDNVNVAPNPDGAFNAAWPDDPTFETGVTVTAGSFEVNGVTINVAADDTVNDVLGAISASAAGVTASYDAATETVRLVHDTPGALPLTVGNDTSGFLAATKLTAAVADPGGDPESDLPLAEVPWLVGLQAGTLLVNGVGIGINPATQSLNDVLLAINQSGAGVTAQLVDNSFLVFRSAADFSLDSNGTGFFEAFNVASDTYRATGGGARPDESTLFAVSRRAKEVVLALNRLFEAPGGAPVAPGLDALRAEAAGLVADLRGGFAALGVDSGLRFATDEVFEARFSDADGRTFRNALRWRLDDVRQLLGGSLRSDADGFIERLLEALDEQVLDDAPIGALVDTFA